MGVLLLYIYGSWEDTVFRDIGPVEIGLVLVIILLVFGAGKLPSIGKDIGKGIREFRKASSENLDDEKKTEAKAAVQPSAPTNEKDAKK